ncbi:S41 family peptidase [Iningainema tapete]|uniref:S41 family peptidase n=1 Tax=Iningainema tapete BLCC-T55 TaxID=2748662 RepID=A0A8J7BWF4_9CYAN|nr:S41 family peptidase [Iningainema tapete]MBD2770868.1 S41 family peptidase [Iningainema tapete BLCC-T55]
MDMRRFLASSSILFLLATAGATSYAASQSSHRQIVDEAWQVINQEFVGANNTSDWQQTRHEFLSRDYGSKKAAYDAIHAMLRKLNDPETRLMDVKQLASFEMEGNGKFVGVGLIDFAVETDEKTKEPRIVTAIADTPAAKAGLQPKDIIQAIDGVPTSGLTHDQVMIKLRGQAGTKVILTVRRQGKTFDVPLLREAISVQPVRTKLLKEADKKIGYIALSQFTPDTSKLMRNAVKELLAQNVNGFLMDLRNNPGGALNVSTDIASIFLNKELVVAIRGRAGKLEQIRASGSRLTDKPVVVLVNNGTASASEVLAGALQDNRRAVLVGTVTSGRGLVHAGKELSDRSMILVTVGSLLTPQGSEIYRKGIKPDYVVEIPQAVLDKSTPANILTQKDTQYNQAITVLIQNIYSIK